MEFAFTKEFDDEDFISSITNCAWVELVVMAKPIANEQLAAEVVEGASWPAVDVASQEVPTIGPCFHSTPLEQHMENPELFEVVEDVQKRNLV